MSATRRLFLTLSLAISAPLRAQQPTPTPMPQSSRTSYFNSVWLNAVVSVERESDGKTGPLGTGFLVRTDLGHTLLFTAKHVVSRDHTAQGKIDSAGLVYRLDPRTKPSEFVRDLDAIAAGFGRWFASDSSDLACRFIGLPADSRSESIPRDLMLQESALQLGAPLLVIGFPFGLFAPEQALPVARRGSVARVDYGSVVIDAFVFPGNSGGPVIYSPAVKVSGALQSGVVNDERLIGVVRDYIYYSDVAVSAQTNRPRVTFEENTGLAEIVPADAIIEMLDSADVKQQDRSIRLVKQ
jgi:hypothetical protein